MSNEEEYPLSCYSGTDNDVFSGWFAVSDTRRCNDFCFWNPANSDDFSDSTLTANPHQMLTVENKSHWGCIHNAARHDVTWSNGYPDFQRYGDASTFPHLQCSRGAKQELHRWQQDWLKSQTFWIIIMILCVTIWVLEFLLYVRFRRKRTVTTEAQSEAVDTRTTVTDHDDVVESTLEENSICLIPSNKQMQPQQQESGINESLQIHDNFDTDPQQSVQRRERSWKWCKMSKLFLILFILINGFILFILFLSILSLIEITTKADYAFTLKVLTPECTPNDYCHDANLDLDNPSQPYAPTDKTVNNTLSFSYLIASDPQLDWYNGESASLGKTNYPPPCSPTDSCDSCTEKFGTYTNAQMKHSLETLIQGGEVRRALNDGPTPKTLVVNGDLTSYFHKREIEKFENFFHNIEGLEHYFPSLGNHDYDQKDGATFNNDEWAGPHSCNGEHSIGYFKSSFCNKVPNFYPKDRITRYDSNSLAYSWEEGPYHFVHLHYHPSYENARLGIRNSFAWLERDLKLASEAQLTSILFIHSARDLTRAMEDILLGNNVAAIFAAHEHRCFGPKCTYHESLSNDEVEKLINATDSINGTDPFEGVEKCFLGGTEVCGGSVTDKFMNLFSLNDMDENLILNKGKLYNKNHTYTGVCQPPSLTFINETDNTLLCRKKTLVESNFPFSWDGAENSTFGDAKIPIFWTGSSSFETFILTDFHSDRFVVNFLTAAAGAEGSRYVDVNQVPNAVYPLHDESDLSELTIFI